MNIYGELLNVRDQLVPLTSPLNNTVYVNDYGEKTRIIDYTETGSVKALKIDVDFRGKSIALHCFHKQRVLCPSGWEKVDNLVPGQPIIVFDALNMPYGGTELRMNKAFITDIEEEVLDSAYDIGLNICIVNRFCIKDVDK